MEDMQDFYAYEILDQAIEFREKYALTFTLQEAINIIIETHKLNHQVKIYDYLESINISLEAIADKIDELISNQ